MDGMEEYLAKKNVGPILKELVSQLCVHKPDNAVEFMVQYLTNKYLNQKSPIDKRTREKEPQDSSSKDSGSDSDSFGEYEDVTNAALGPASKLARTGRRGAICAEPIGSPSDVSIKGVPKSKEDQERLAIALKKHIMFAHLEEEERQAVFDAMVEVKYKKGDVIIRQGDEGDNFYVVETGECDIFVSKDGEPPKHVAVVGKYGSFGELALIYNSPRAATVVAKVDCTLWAIDRATYRHVLMNSTIEKRKMYESFLEKVPILEQLTKWERMVIADALETHTFAPGDVVIKEGELGDRFYIIVEGEAKVYQQRDKGPEHIASLHKSDYFGEIALLTDRPRAATVIAADTLKCASVDRDRFNRVLGPCENILRRNMENYNRYMSVKI